ncbi:MULTISPECIES: SPFH domain-containing protein [Streptomyces]|uniref:SPFH domain-containing protein n=1 Tax=Streptomyces TaxID=1883 RepID=UPI00163CFC54|nr:MULTISPECIES: SPFH domain-containing protein [Streptomyces]MBC2878137.1 membrane protease subunit [Streptomyces sp. TYQ1024]UBI39639.1 SPFH domain-containing protein [Streptomyces mobaraensis]UKW32216.1 SPFH domain-containing protein [Streptomyces sp. TYQ1024]
MVEDLVVAVVAAASAGAVYLMAAARVVKQYERGVVLRLGRLRSEVRPPGFTLIIPGVDRLRKVNMQIVTMPVPAQEGITRDNVTVRVDAVVYFKVVNAAEAVIQVEDYRFAVSQMAQTSLRSIIGKSDLDDLLSNREKLNQGLELMLDSPAIGWGVQIDRVEIKDVSLPETMKRSMSRQAEAERERRARVINADAELLASKKLAEAAATMSEQPSALQLRLLQTIVAVAAEKNSTLVLPFPVELLRFLERAGAGAPTGERGPGARGSGEARRVDGPDADADAGERAVEERASAERAVEGRSAVEQALGGRAVEGRASERWTVEDWDPKGRPAGERVARERPPENTGESAIGESATGEPGSDATELGDGGPATRREAGGPGDG